jgi:hypothetical protein
LVKVFLEIENRIDILEIIAGFKGLFLGDKIVFPLITALAEKRAAAFFMQSGKAALVNCSISKIVESPTIEQMDLSDDCFPVTGG